MGQRSSVAKVSPIVSQSSKAENPILSGSHHPEWFGSGMVYFIVFETAKTIHSPGNSHEMYLIDFGACRA